MANQYTELKRKHEKERNDFPMAFAFSNKQFDEAMEKLGLKTTDTDKVYMVKSLGMIYRKSDAPALHAMVDRHHKEEEEAIAADPTGDGFIFDMFDYELGNHEYSYTWDTSDALIALGLTHEQVNEDPRLKHGLNKARRAQTQSV